MPNHVLRLTIDRMAPGAAAAFGPPAPVRACYVAEGGVMLRADGLAAAVGPDSAWFGGEAAVEAGANGATVLRYELWPARAAPAEDAALTAGLELDDAEGYLLRCDKVELPPGGIAYTHTHQGGGIRCLLGGGFNVRTEGRTRSVGAFEAWFESGPEPVLAWAPDDKPGRFSRAMVLPRRLKGRSSIRYVNPEDADKPKLQRYTVFLDEFIET